MNPNPKSSRKDVLWLHQFHRELHTWHLFPPISIKSLPIVRESGKLTNAFKDVFIREPIAVVDVGGNSAETCILLPNHHVMIMKDKLVSGKSLGKHRRIHAGAQRILLTALHRSLALMERLDIPAERIWAIGTAGVRDAKNKKEVVENIHKLGLNFHILEGKEEGKLVYYSVMHHIPYAKVQVAADTDVLVVEMGGKSTELVVGKGQTTVNEKQTKVLTVGTGSVNLEDYLFDGEIKRIRKKISKQLDDHLKPKWRQHVKPATLFIKSSDELEALNTFNGFYHHRDEEERYDKQFAVGGLTHQDIQYYLSPEGRREIKKGFEENSGKWDPSLAKKLVCKLVMLDELMKRIEPQTIYFGTNWGLKFGLMQDFISRLKEKGTL